MICAICSNTQGNGAHEVREMMFGSRDPFTYTECGHCGCLWLVDVPADMARPCPVDYYSFGSRPELPTGLLKRIQSSRVPYVHQRREWTNAVTWWT